MLKLLSLVISAAVEGFITGSLIFTINHIKFELKKCILYCISSTVLVSFTMNLPINFASRVFLNLYILSFLCKHIYKINFAKAISTIAALMVLILSSELLSELLLRKLPLQYANIICSSPIIKLRYYQISSKIPLAILAIITHILISTFRKKTLNNTYNT